MQASSPPIGAGRLIRLIAAKAAHVQDLRGAAAATEQGASALGPSADDQGRINDSHRKASTVTSG